MTNGFDEALMKNPFDWELRRIYADWLEDTGGRSTGCISGVRGRG